MDTISRDLDYAEEFTSPRGYARKMSKYEIEKLHGMRRDTGAMKLTRLKPRHYRVLFLHMQGIAGGSIAKQLGLSEAHVSLIINDPLSQAFISRGLADVDGEFRALLGPTVNMLRENLDHKDPAVRQRAGETILRVNGKFERKVDANAPSAESLIQRLLEQVPSHRIERQVNVQVNVGKGVDPYIVEQLGSLGKCPISELEQLPSSREQPPASTPSERQEPSREDTSSDSTSLPMEPTT